MNLINLSGMTLTGEHVIFDRLNIPVEERVTMTPLMKVDLSNRHVNGYTVAQAKKVVNSLGLRKDENCVVVLPDDVLLATILVVYLHAVLGYVPPVVARFNDDQTGVGIVFLQDVYSGV